MAVITISRQFAAGGSDVAQLLAERLGWTVVDHEFVEAVAARTELSPEKVEEREERVPSLIDRLARALAFSTPESLLAAGDRAALALTQEERLVKITERVIAEAAERRDVILVGRGSKEFLSERSDTLHVYLVAPLETRIDRAMERLDLARKEALERLEEIDSGRQRYVREHYGRNWSDPTNYHLVLNSGVFSYEQIADLVVGAVKAHGWA